MDGCVSALIVSALDPIAQAPQIEAFRRDLDNDYRRRYRGWSDAIDQRFDGHSTWYVAKATDLSKPPFLRVCRAAAELPLPTQQLAEEWPAGLSGATHEINNFLYSKDTRELAIALVLQVFRVLVAQGAGDCICVVDARRQGLLRLNVDTFRFADTGHCVRFPSYCYADRPELVRWRVLCQTAASRRQLLADHPLGWQPG